MTEEISKKVLEKIKKEEIKPEAKWKFLLKDYFVWGLFAASIMIGTLAVAVIIFGIKISDWDMYDRLAGGPIKFLIMTLSYFWLLIFLAFVFVAYYNLKHTKKGYKYNIFVITAISLSATLLLGGFAYAVGIGEKLENSLTKNAPFYRGVDHKRQEIWNQAEEGLLAGRIIEIKSDSLDLEDIERIRWQVFTGQAEFMPMVVIKKGEMIRIFGKKLDDKNFEASRVMPWKKMGGPGVFLPPPPIK